MWAVPDVVERAGLGELTFLAEVPEPKAVLGYDLGERHTPPELVLRYFEAVAAHSPRVFLQEHGITYEGRPLFHAVVSDPVNLRRWEEIQQQNRRLVQDPNGVTDADLLSMPVVVWLGYSVHGNEASGSEAAMAALYVLAAGEGEPVDRILRDCVILILPMLNPDGRNRFVDWVNAHRGRVPTADPEDREHREPWPGGRTNHYWFDLNRDWLPAQLQESQARLELYHQWKPQVVADFHEMGSESTFFFQPGIPGRTHPLTPEENILLTRRIAEFHARYLDRLRRLYFSEEVFDDYYYGKGSTYPDVNGAVGILFEQAGSRALRRETTAGLLTYDETILNPLVTSISTLDAAASLGSDLLRFQRDFFRRALSELPEGAPTAWVFDLEADGGRAVPLVDVLLRHDIAVYRPARPLRIGERELQPDRAVVVPARQAQGVLLAALMERVTEFSDSQFYDISTWTLPLAFGVVPLRWEGDLGDLLGERLDRRSRLQRGEVSGDPAPYAWVLDAANWRSPEAAYRIQDAGFAVRLLLDPVTVRVAGEMLRLEAPRYVVPVPAGAEGVRLGELVRNLAEQLGVRFAGVSSGLTPEGPDLGGPSSFLLRKPVVGLIVGEGVSAGVAGATWFVLNERYGLPVSLLDLDRLNRIDLDRYNTLVLPPARSGSLPEGLAAELSAWVRRGGVLVAVGDAVRRLIEQELVAAKVRNTAAVSSQVSWKERSAARRAQTIPGTIFEVRLDTSHPIAAGLPERFPVFRSSELMVERAEAGGVNVAVYTEKPLLSGYVSEERLAELAGSAAVQAFSLGRGAVVLFVDDPNFRGFWYGTTTLFMNAVLFGGVY
ncbi:MAG: M14 family metallopeptidase [Acidobacteriota bacterium]